MSRPTLPDPPKDCVACGACCLSSEQSYIRVFEVDFERMDAAARALTETKGAVRSMRFVNGHCAALKIDKERRTLHCNIYLQRPDACRWLQQGSQQCREQVRDKARRALALLPPR